MAEALSTDPVPEVHVYHCICTNPILASTRPLSALTRRVAGADEALILPLPDLPESVNVSDTEKGDASFPRLTEYARLLSTTGDGKAIIVRRDDGFEKRHVQKCSRCHVPVGYHLDWAQFPSQSSGVAVVSPQPTSGPNTSILYLLPGGLLSTDDMVAGKDMTSAVKLG